MINKCQEADIKDLEEAIKRVKLGGFIKILMVEWAEGLTWTVSKDRQSQKFVRQMNKPCLPTKRKTNQPERK